MTGAVVNINEVLEGHVCLDITCVDRLHLNAHVPNLQVGGQSRPKPHAPSPHCSSYEIRSSPHRRRREEPETGAQAEPLDSRRQGLREHPRGHSGPLRPPRA
jgi:hypothetical protein